MYVKSLELELDCLEPKVDCSPVGDSHASRGSLLPHLSCSLSTRRHRVAMLSQASRRILRRPTSFQHRLQHTAPAVSPPNLAAHRSPAISAPAHSKRRAQQPLRPSPLPRPPPAALSELDQQLAAAGFDVGSLRLQRNAPVAQLYEDAVKLEGAVISSSRALINFSGKKTGRSPKDKRCVS